MERKVELIVPTQCRKLQYIDQGKSSRYIVACGNRGISKELAIVIRDGPLRIQVGANQQRPLRVNEADGFLERSVCTCTL